MKNVKKRRVASTFEVAAIACFIMGFALYIAIDTGVVKIGLGGKSSSEESLDLGNTRVARIKALQDKIDGVETKMQERVEVLAAMNQELEKFAQKIGRERRTIGEMAKTVFDVERIREELAAEPFTLARSPTAVADVHLGSKLTEVAEAAREAGISGQHVSSIKWKSKSYLRLIDAFEFQKKGPYLRMPGLEKADAIADAIEDAEIGDITVVYNDDEDSPKSMSRQRAWVIRNHLRELLGGDHKVAIKNVNSEFVATGSVEIWMGQE